LTTQIEKKHKPRKRATNVDDDDEADDTPSPVASTTTNVCQTVFFWCTMNVSGPVGAACWCVHPLLGTATGITIPVK
jgi:hypothetical protein